MIMMMVVIRQVCTFLASTKSFPRISFGLFSMSGFLHLWCVCLSRLLDRLSAVYDEDGYDDDGDDIDDDDDDDDNNDDSDDDDKTGARVSRRHNEFPLTYQSVCLSCLFSCMCGVSVCLACLSDRQQ